MIDYPTNTYKTLTLKEAVAWCKENGINVSEWGLRHLVKSGKIPCRQPRQGGKYFINTRNILRYFYCDDGQDNPPCEPTNGIKPIM